MIPKRFEEITKTDIDALVANAVAEGRTIEYKRELPGNSDEDKREFLADVSSFANAAGGDIIYGVEEDQGIPTVANGLPGIDPDAEILRLDNIIRNGIDPRIPTVQIKAVNGFPAGPVMVVRVPKSWSSPHMVVYKGSSRFFTRDSAAKHQLDVTEIRSAFLFSETVPERIRRFRDDRLSKIISGETPVAMESGGKAILHLLPVSAFTKPVTIDVRAFASGVQYLNPIVDGPWNGRRNVDGYVSCWPLKSNEYCCYTQLFRSGSIEAVDGFSLVKHHGGQMEAEFESRLVNALRVYLKLLVNLGVDPPLVVLLSMVGAKGAKMPVVQNYRDGGQVFAIDRDVLILPDVLVEDFDQAPGMILKPLLDAVWQATGYMGSPSYDSAGNFTPRRIA